MLAKMRRPLCAVRLADTCSRGGHAVANLGLRRQNASFRSVSYLHDARLKSRHVASFEAYSCSNVKLPVASSVRWMAGTTEASRQELVTEFVEEDLRDESVGVDHCRVVVDDFLRKELDAFAAMEPHPLSVDEILEMGNPKDLARFIHSEVPIRYSERIRDIELIPGWRDSEDLVELYEYHVDVFQNIRLLQKTDDDHYEKLGSMSDPHVYTNFNDVVLQAQRMGAGIPFQATRAMKLLHDSDRELYTIEFADKWLDDFLLNWIGTTTLLGQYIACAQGQPNGIIDPDLDVSELCKGIASTIQDMCMGIYGRRPHIIVESFSAVEADERAPHFSYIPQFLQFVMQEILKNCCRATLDTCPVDKLPKRPTTVKVCADEQQVAIRINDRGRGIPFHVGDKIWSYMYSTGSKTKPVRGDYGDGPTPLVGYGCGLPLSKLYCRYLGGRMRVVSWPGYGVDVHLWMPRVSSEQREVVPDKDLLQATSGHDPLCIWR